MTKPIQVFTEIVAEYANRGIALNITFEEWKAMGEKKHVPCPSGISEKCVGFVDMTISGIRCKYGCGPCGDAKRLATKRTRATPQQRSAYKRVCEVYQNKGIELNISLEQFTGMGVTKHVPCLSNLSPDCDKFVDIPTDHIHRLVGCMACRNYRMRQTMLERHGVEHAAQMTDHWTKIEQTSTLRYGTAHPLQSEKVRAKIRDTNMERFGVPTPFHLQTIQVKAHETTLENRCVKSASQDTDRSNIHETALENSDVKSTSQGTDTKAKIRETNLERYGVDNVFKNPDIKAKIRATNLERYGVDNVFKSPAVQTKIRATNLEKRGVEYAAQDPTVQAKIRATNLERRGVEYAAQDPTVMAKVRETMKATYGAEHMLQVPELRAKRDATMVERYGSIHALQNPELAEKMTKSRFELVPVELSDGRTVDLQGYEPQALEWLLSTDTTFIDPVLGRSLHAEDMIFGKTNVPEIFYNGHRYYTDFAVHNSNTLIEVKSPYTLRADWDVNLEKFRATIENDFALLLVLWYKKRLVQYMMMETIKELDDAIPRMLAIPHM